MGEKSAMPKAGDYALLGHGMIDPDYWWISLVEWAGKEAILCRDTHGSHPNNALTIVYADSIILAGTKDECLQVYLEARRLREDFRPRFNEAKNALRAVQDEINGAVGKIVGDAALKLAGDVRMIEP